jgi:glycosyltransferase involved in cell wall biosynthesis
MRIAMVSEHASPLATLGGADGGGQNVHVASLARALARDGHDVVVHTRRDGPGLPRVVEVDGYAVDHLDAGPAHPVPKDRLLAHVPEMAGDLARTWSRTSPDVVHAHFWMSGLAAVRARRAAGLRMPVVLTFHALGTVKRAHLGPDDPSPDARIELERRLAREVDLVVATAAAEARELRGWGVPGDRLEVVPCGVDPRRFHPDRPAPGARRVVSLGRLVPRKGVADVVAALADVPGATLTVAGGPPPAALDADPEVARLREVARRAGVADRVGFVGAVPSSAVPALLASADAVVCAPWYEPFGIVPLEAMAAGRPLVATAVGGILDSVRGQDPGRTGVLVPPGEPAALAAALRAVLDDPVLAARLGRAGAARVAARFSWERVAAATAAAYALAGGSARAGQRAGQPAVTR